MKKKPEKNWTLDSGFWLRRASTRQDCWAIYEGGKLIEGCWPLEDAKRRAQELRKS